MRKNFWLVAGVAFCAVCRRDAPIQAQFQVRPPSPYGEVSPSMLKRKIAQFTARRNALLQEFTPNSPEVRALEKEIISLRRQLQRQFQSPRALPPGRNQQCLKVQLLAQ